MNLLSLAVSIAMTASAQNAVVPGSVAEVAVGATAGGAAALAGFPSAKADLAFPLSLPLRTLATAGEIAGSSNEKKGCAGECARCPLAASCKGRIAKLALANPDQTGGRRLTVLQNAPAIEEALKKAPDATLGETFDQRAKGTDDSEADLPAYRRLSGTSMASPLTPADAGERARLRVLDLASQAQEHATTSTYPDTFMGRAHARFDAWLADFLHDAFYGNYGARYRERYGPYRKPGFPSLRRR